jgi:hypothetical protein
MRINILRLEDKMKWRSLEDGHLLGCTTMWTGISLPVFQRTVLPPSSILIETELYPYNMNREDGLHLSQS